MITELTGQSFVAGKRTSSAEHSFHAINPITGSALEPSFASAGLEDVELAARAAAEAFTTFSKTPASARAALLREVAAGLDAAVDGIVSRAHLETGLPEPRLRGEVARASGQLRLFASVLDEGSWQNARIDTALPERKPLPRPDLRSMLVPIGPVAVFGASNFPIAFSVAGGDTASALAAGNPVIVKAHPAHPGTSELVAAIITDAVALGGFHPGVFSMLFDSGFAIGKALVVHPAMQAVAFTGSRRAGRALMDLAASREAPIPCFTEMSSLNPVFVLPSALAANPAEVAKALHGSFTLGSGQFCTKPGLIFVPECPEQIQFRDELRSLTEASPAFTMLTPQIAQAYRSGVAERRTASVVATSASQPDAATTGAALFETDIDTFCESQVLREELFGPSTLLVAYASRASLLAAAESLEGHLTATILGSEEELTANMDLVTILERKVGRLLLNGFPTGVEVSQAMVHGGPYPATSDSRFTSVGAQAILRFVRPRCYQNFPQSALPQELRDDNPCGIMRLVDGVLTRQTIPMEPR